MRRKGRVEEAHGNSERWLLTYADLITLLLVFFVVMYSISKADDRKFNMLNASLQKAFGGLVLEGDDKTAVGGGPGPVSGNSIMEDFLGLRNQIEMLKGDMGLQNQININRDKEGISISLSGSLLFDSGRAELRPEAASALDRIAETFRHMPNDVRVEGHTDNIQVDSDLYPTNWELSAARATAVARYLAEVDGISPKRLSAQGYAEFRPVASNDTRESRALNRRVDLLIVYDER